MSDDGPEGKCGAGIFRDIPSAREPGWNGGLEWERSRDWSREVAARLMDGDVYGPVVVTLQHASEAQLAEAYPQRFSRSGEGPQNLYF